MKTGSYYFWKWADNDLPGRPAEVHADLLRGEMHPALQIFDARPLLKKLQSAAARRRRYDEEWDWEVTPGDAPERAQFVFVTCPQLNGTEERVRWFSHEFVPLGLSGYGEESGQLIPCLPPKLNSFILGQFPYEPSYDISIGDLPVLLRRIRPSLPEPWGELLDQHRLVFATAVGRRFRVEWQEFRIGKTPDHFDRRRALDRQRLAALGAADDRVALPRNQDPDFLRFADALRIFEAFLRGEPRPDRYFWRKINDFAP